MFFWQTKENEHGQKGATCAVGAFTLVIMPVRDESKAPVDADPNASIEEREAALFAGYTFRIVGMQGGGFDYMSVSPTMEEARSRAEMTFLSTLMGALSCLDEEDVKYYIKSMKVISQPTLEEATNMAILMDKRYRDIREEVESRFKQMRAAYDAAAVRPGSTQVHGKDLSPCTSCNKGHPVILVEPVDPLTSSIVFKCSICGFMETTKFDNDDMEGLEKAFNHTVTKWNQRLSATPEEVGEFKDHVK